MGNNNKKLIGCNYPINVSINNWYFVPPYDNSINHNVPMVGENFTPCEISINRNTPKKVVPYN